MAEFVASRRVGDATVAVISEGSLPWVPWFQVLEEEHRAILVFAHERFPALGRIVRAGGGYRWERDC